MSSLRNSLHRRNHKERSQVSSRARFGLLEKHKDYVLRARDYHSKQDRIKRLQQKAAERNKDEFYFGMNRQRTQGGVHVQDRGNTALPTDFIKILKTQDENYIRTMRAAGLKKIEKLKAQLTELADLIAPYLTSEKGAEEESDGLDEEELDVLRQAGIIKAPKSRRQTAKRSSKHIIFVENVDEAQRYVNRQTSSSKARTDTLPKDTDEENDTVDLGWRDPVKSKRNRKGDSKMDIDEEEDTALVSERREAAKKHRTRLLKELSARLTRDTQLRYAERELTMQRALMGKGGSLKLRGVEKVEGEDEDNGLNEDELDSMRIKRSEKMSAKKEQAYKPRVYRWRLERKK
ncbi:u3 small nucleolar RNA-associated protein 11 [Fomitiporia mediterranea MF3/22]|uniref:u3 small nucleolar RNA-associated protein 11 n=1 Tax=Fomitiporia mediterranea (strain MF3/22) TaxID=694068 RepID=UPI0004407518|nr:u3 small nucleolar RNA-associated protein 11 [Fomitiporia mediterranea MF3/22]EJD03662.1 u3 small nucleolar RNA-associated protein 11 [Fomitiporia mediterranea MF3/22]